MHRCLCIPGTPEYDWYPVDGYIEIIAPPSMLGTWHTEFKSSYDKTSSDLDMIFVTGYAQLGKGGDSLSSWCTQ